MTDAVGLHVAPTLPLIGIHDSVAEAREALAARRRAARDRATARRTRVLTRQDLLAYLSR